MGDTPEYPGKLVARLITDTPSDYMPVVDSLADFRAQLPPGLNCSKRQPADLSNLVELWLE